VPGSQLQIWLGLISRIARPPSKRAAIRIILGVLSRCELRAAFHGRARPPTCPLTSPASSDTERSAPTYRMKSRHRCGKSAPAISTGLQLCLFREFWKASRHVPGIRRRDYFTVLSNFKRAHVDTFEYGCLKPGPDPKDLEPGRKKSGNFDIWNESRWSIVDCQSASNKDLKLSNVAVDEVF